MRFGSRYCEDVVLFFGICTTTGKHEVWTMNPPSPTIGPDLFSRNDSSTLNILDCAGAIRTEIGLHGYCSLIFFGICTTTGKHEVWTTNPTQPNNWYSSLVKE